MKSIVKKLIWLIILAIFLFITNPNLKKHQDKIVEKYKQENPITGAFGAGEAVSRAIAYENYYVFSRGKISINNEPVSFGIAGFVIVHGKLDLMKYKDKLEEIVN
jgi:hypothetical protein